MSSSLSSNPRPVRAALFLAALMFLSVATATVAAESADSLSGVVNVNTATSEQLVLLPGIGESKARAILAARGERGSFGSVDELLEVKGIGERALERIRPFVALDGRTTLARE